MTHFHRCGGVVNPLDTQLHQCMEILVFCLCYEIIHFLPTWQAWVRHKRITPVQHGLHDKAVHMMFLTRQNTLSIVYNVISWFLICHLSYFTRKYRPTFSAWSSVHACAPHNINEKWHMRTHTRTHARTHTHHATVNNTRYLYMFNLFTYLFN